MQEFPKIEGEHLSVQAEYQIQKLKKLLAYLLGNSPFYQRKFKETAFSIESIKRLEDLSCLPTTSKEDLQVFHHDFLCIPKSEIREYTTTSGTLGNPVPVALSENDLKRLAYNEMLSFQLMGMKKGDVLQLMLTLDRQFMAGMAYYTGAHAIGASVIRSGSGLPQLQWETIQRFQTSHLVAVPSFLIKMLHEQPKDLQLKDCPVQSVLAIGESLRTADLENNTLAKNILNNWPIKLFGTYASTEMQTAFTECSEGKGGHHHPELIIVELLDENNVPVKPGQVGEVTITTLGVEAMPLLRYKTGDLCKGYDEPCACGRKTLRLGPVLARKKQMIKYKGTSIYPSTIIDLILNYDAIEDYVLKIEKDEMGQDRISVYLQTKQADEVFQTGLKDLFRQKIRVVPEIHILNPQEMNKMQYPNGNRKPFKVQDNRPECY